MPRSATVIGGGTVELEPVAFEAKFKRADELHEKAMDRGRQFFIALQQSGRGWLSLGTTKTGLVYRLKGNPPQAHE